MDTVVAHFLQNTETFIIFHDWEMIIHIWPPLRYPAWISSTACQEKKNKTKSLWNYIVSDLFLGSLGSETVTIPLCSYMYSIFYMYIFVFFVHVFNVFNVLNGISLIILVYNPNSFRNMCRYISQGVPVRVFIVKIFSHVV